MGIFHGYVSLPEGKVTNEGLGWNPACLWNVIRHSPQRNILDFPEISTLKLVNMSLNQICTAIFVLPKGRTWKKPGEKPPKNSSQKPPICPFRTTPKTVRPVLESHGEFGWADFSSLELHDGRRWALAGVMSITHLGGIKCWCKCSS